MSICSSSMRSTHRYTQAYPQALGVTLLSPNPNHCYLIEKIMI
jgi:hypothetical protein